MNPMNPREQLSVVALALLAALPAPAAGLTLAQALSKIDQIASHFKGLSANIQTVQHMNAIHEDDEQTGSILVKRLSRNNLHVKVAFDKPEPKTAVADNKKIDVYYASSAEIQEWDVGQRRSMLDMILALGFGGTSRELQDDYQVSLGGPDTVGGEAATRLELIPKLREMLEQWRKIELWISDKTGYAVQQKFYQAGRDYMLITYTNVQTRSDIPDSEFALPKGAKKQPLNKKK